MSVLIFIDLGNANTPSSIVGLINGIPVDLTRNWHSNSVKEDYEPKN